MIETALTPEQQSFAADNHNLVYAFLNEKKLSDDDFYDVVVFGYLRAVKRFFEEPNLSQKYSFSTIAWGAMRSKLFNHYKSNSRQGQYTSTVSLDAFIYGDDEALSLQEVLSAPDSNTVDFETELIMLELASKVSKREMDVIRMKADGFGVREIARAKRMPMRGVNELLAGVRDTAFAVCYE